MEVGMSLCKVVHHHELGGMWKAFRFKVRLGGFSFVPCIFGTAEHFATKLGVVMNHHISQSGVWKAWKLSFDCASRSNSQSEGSDPLYLSILAESPSRCYPSHMEVVTNRRKKQGIFAQNKPFLQFLEPHTFAIREKVYICMSVTMHFN